MYFKNHDYTDDNLGAPSNVNSVRENYPLDGAAPMERPPLGGEGYQRDVDSLIDIFDVDSFKILVKFYSSSLIFHLPVLRTMY
jgi:hypothetical protein